MGKKTTEPKQRSTRYGKAYRTFAELMAADDPEGIAAHRLDSAWEETIAKKESVTP